MGELFFYTLASPGANLYACTATNTWSALASGGGGGGGGTGLWEIQSDGASAGSRARLNFVPGLGTTLNCVDDAANSRVTCTVNLDSSSLSTTYSRIGAANIYTSGFLQDLSAARLRLPVQPAAEPTLSGEVQLDQNSLELRIGRGGTRHTLALQDTGSQPLTIRRENSSAGTLNNLLARMDANGQISRPAVTDNGGVVGVVLRGAGNSGIAEIATMGVVPCYADNSTTVGNFVVIGSGSAGRCRDAGPAYPTTGQVLGRWLQGVGGGNPGNVLLFGAGPQQTSRAILSGGGWGEFSGTAYASFAEPGTDASSNNRFWLAPSAGTIRNLYLRRDSTNQTHVCTLLRNGSATALSVTIAPGSSSGSDLTHPVSVAQGDNLIFQCTSTGTGSRIRAVTALLEM